MLPAELTSTPSLVWYLIVAASVPDACSVPCRMVSATPWPRRHASLLTVQVLDRALEAAAADGERHCGAWVSAGEKSDGGDGAYQCLRLRGGWRR
jgi:hypothetical protein